MTVPNAVPSDGSKGLATTQPASPSAADPTHTREPERPAPPAPAEDVPSLAAQIRNPERYRILGEHGRGALGRVSRAHDRELGRDVAIKELISRGHVHEVRFLREALITARLEHPGIVPVHEAGRWPDGTPFYAMKLVAGRSLRDLLAERTAVDQRIALLHHVIAVADALAYAHGKHIVHRDLKPANVIVGDFGETVVIDWGLAKDLSAGEESSAGGGAVRIERDDDLTATGAVLGTPAYMPPEQRRGEPVDQRADVFAIGAMLWELCALERTPPAGAAQRRRTLRRAGIDQDLVTIIDKAVDPDPSRRYPDAGALAADLKAFKSGARIAARRYSLLAMLAHWTRRHRALAASVAAAIALGVTGGALYVRNIAAERDRADQERDRARLSEASVLLEKDPTRARDLLGSLTVRSPQYALLMSRARQGAAARVVSGLAGVAGLLRARGTAELALRTTDGELYRLDPRTGARRLVDHDVEGAVTYRAGDWLYARKPFGASAMSVATPSNRRALDTGGLTGISRLVALADAVYALDTSNDLYRLSTEAPALVRRGVHQIAGDGGTLLVCAQDGALEVLRAGAVVLRRRCPQNASPETMAVTGDDYAALTDDGTLIASRGGRTVEMPAAISGEYELALSSAGVLAVAEYGPGGRTWFVRADASVPEHGPLHATAPVSVAAGGRFAAWGFSDGTVIVAETTTGAVWELKGHPDAVTNIVIDGDRGTLVTTSSQELRLWTLPPPPVGRVGQIPCSTFHTQVSPDGARVALDCSEGGAWFWSRSAGTVAQLHQHLGHAYGVQWLGDLLCSSGWDGKVLCSTIDGRTTRTFDPGGGRIIALAGIPGADFLVFATADGRIWQLDRDVHLLYSQDAGPYRLAVSPDGTRVASGGRDGSLVVFDRARGRVVSRVLAHRGSTRSVVWSGDAVFTSGMDGALRRWSLEGDALQLRHEVREAAPVQLIEAFAGGWAYSIDGGTLVIVRAGAAPLRLELGKPIYAIDVSSDLRYVAASVLGEIVAVDLRADRLATLAIDSRFTGYVGFVDARSLAVSATTGLKLVHIYRLDYIRF